MIDYDIVFDPESNGYEDYDTVEADNGNQAILAINRMWDEVPEAGEVYAIRRPGQAWFHLEVRDISVNTHHYDVRT